MKKNKLSESQLNEIYNSIKNLQSSDENQFKSKLNSETGANKRNIIKIIILISYVLILIISAVLNKEGAFKFLGVFIPVVVMIISYLAIIMSAFQQSSGWGLLSVLLAPIAGIIFCLSHFKEENNKGPFVVFIISIALFVLTILLGAILKINL